METEQTFTATKPAYRGDGIAIWKNTAKNGKPYLSVKVLGGKSIACFPVEEKE